MFEQRRGWILAASASLAVVASCSDQHTEPTATAGAASAARAERAIVTSVRHAVPRAGAHTLDPPRSALRHDRAPLRFTAPPRDTGAAADFLAAPQVRSAMGGQVLPSPHFAAVFFDANDPNRAAVTGFVASLGTSAYWSAAAEYGVGPGASLDPVVLRDPPPAMISDDEIQAWLIGQLGASPPGLPPADFDNVYTLFFPASTTVTLQGGAWKSCAQFGAYHNFISLPSGKEVVYAVIPSCNGYLGFHGLEAITNAASHELLESATDPYGQGFDDPDWQGSGWAQAFEGSPSAELSDFCEFQPGVSSIDSQLGHTVQRYYSNAAAAAWHDPCVPAPARTYFNAQPLVGGTAIAPFEWTKGVSIPPGGRVTIPVRLFADGHTGPWKLSAAEEANPHLAGDPWHQLSFHFDEPEGRAGDIRFLTIERSPRPDGAPLGPLPFAIISTQGDVQNLWWVVVGDGPSDRGLAPELPNLVTLGGPVVSSPRLVPVTYAADALGPSFTDFVTQLAARPYLASLTEYGVGPATAGRPVTIPGAPPAAITNLQIETWLASAMQSGAVPAPDASTVYVLAFPDATEVDMDFGGGAVFPVCNVLGAAYHDSVPGPSGAPVPFVVSARCPGFLGLGALDAVTVPTSAEIGGALTNPFAFDPAWALPDFAGSSWAVVNGGEVGELCESLPDGISRDAVPGYAVSRLYSNGAASATRNPCVPASRSYFNAAPIVDGTEWYPFNFAHGVTIPAGASTTIPVRLFGHPASGRDWTLSASTAGGPLGQLDPFGTLSFAFDKTTGDDGDIRWLTITRAQEPPGAPAHYLHAFAIVSTAGSESHEWLVTVGE